MIGWELNLLAGYGGINHVSDVSQARIKRFRSDTGYALFYFSN
jgi:hypothetical protein